jgi:hypothetical protein
VTEEKAKKPSKESSPFPSIFFQTNQCPTKEWSFMNAAWHPLSPENPSHPLTRKSSCLNLQGEKNKQTNKQTHIADEEVKPNLGSEQ